MSNLPRGLGVRLITVSIAIVAVAAAVVGAVVTKLSEDDAKQRLARQTTELARMVYELASAGAGQEQMDRAVLGSRLRQVGSGWVLDREGRLIATADPRLRETEGSVARWKIELISAQQPISERTVRGTGSRMSLLEVIDRYSSGTGVVRDGDEPRLVAFRVLGDRGWLVGLDEPYEASTTATASLKKYVLLTCLVLGLSILLSTAISISFIIKPYYRERLELSERIEAANRTLQKLHEVSVGMQKSLALDDRIHRILGAAHEVLGLDRIFIYLPNDENTVLECRGAFGNQDEPAEEIRLPLGPDGGVIAQAYLQRRVFRVENSRDLPADLRLQPPLDEIRALRSRSFVVVPMIVGSDCVGVVAMDNQRTKAPITDETIEGLERFISQAAVAIENARLYQQLKLYADELEVTDHLTQLFTFFHFKKLLQGEIERARVSGSPLSLVVFRIDNFARYNELLGHRHGDEVLRQVAAAIRKVARKRDVIGRCYGSTFGLALPQTDAEAAASVVAELVERLHAADYPGVDTLPEGRLAFAVGFAEYRRGEAGGAEEFFAAVNERSKGVEA